MALTKNTELCLVFILIQMTRMAGLLWSLYIIENSQENETAHRYWFSFIKYKPVQWPSNFCDCSRNNGNVPLTKTSELNVIISTCVPLWNRHLKNFNFTVPAPAEWLRGHSDSLKNNMLDVDDCFASSVQPLCKIYMGNKKWLLSIVVFLLIVLVLKRSPVIWTWK